MASTDYTFASELFFEELLRISSTIVWKDPVRALGEEVQARLPYVEQFILSRQGRLTFPLVEQFHEEVLYSLGLNEEDVNACMDNHNNIPIELRDLAVERETEYMVNYYDEPNNYYRQLHGLPDTSDTEEDWFYNTEYPDISSPDEPIHELNASQLHALEATGFIAKLISENPDKKYLKHMTDRKIDLYTARQSEAFGILWVEESDYDVLMQDFLDTYNECRYMITTVFYQKVLSTNNTEYSGFIGMMILFQTLLQMHRKFLDTDITRDFYDEDSLRLVYDSYDVPFFRSIPMEFHRKIVKNINILLSHKGSTRVFYDLFDIFGLDDMAVFEFYMMKVHKFRDGKPVFYYNEDGSLDQRSTYTIKFGKVKLYDDPTTEMQQTKNQIEYNDMIRNDPYWINDKDLLDKIYSEEFNYMDSKYLGIQTTFNLMQIIYEVTYYMKILLDNREALNNTAIYNSGIHAYTNIFDLVIYISALIMKKYDFEGNIPTDLHQIGKVMGFNFQQDLVALQNDINENDYLKGDHELLQYLETMSVYSLDSVKKVYTNLTELRKHIVRKMTDTDDVPTYMAYYELYQTIMYSEYTNDTFRKSNGQVASSFSDLLSDINPSLYTKWNNLSGDELDDEISDSLYIMKNSCSALKSFQYADSITIDTLVEYLFKLLEFFKSAKADLTGYEIVFSLISSGDNIMKLMNCIVHIEDNYPAPNYSEFDELTDLIVLVTELQKICDRYKLIAEMPYQWHSNALQDTIEYLQTKIMIIKDTMKVLVSSQTFIEDIKGNEISFLQDDSLPLEDKVFVLWEEIREILHFLIKDEFEIWDIISEITENTIQPLSKEEKIRLVDRLTVSVFMRFKSEFSLDGVLTHIDDIHILEKNIHILDSIITFYNSKSAIKSKLTPDDIITYAKEIPADPKKSEITFSDSDKTVLIEEISMLNQSILDNYIEYRDSVIAKFYRHYIDEPLLFEEECKVSESYDHIWKSEYSLFDVPQKEVIHVEIPQDTITFSEQLILRSDIVYEE